MRFRPLQSAAAVSMQREMCRGHIGCFSLLHVRHVLSSDLTTLRYADMLLWLFLGPASASPICSLPSFTSACQLEYDPG